jgi:hypothetical protein
MWITKNANYVYFFRTYVNFYIFGIFQYHFHPSIYAIGFNIWLLKLFTIHLWLRMTFPTTAEVFSEQVIK